MSNPSLNLSKPLFSVIVYYDKVYNENIWSTTDDKGHGN